MKRSNRLILLIGLFLAVVAFVGVVMLLGQQQSNTTTPQVPTTTKIVVAATDIPLGTTITSGMLGMLDVEIAKKPTDSYELPGQVVGQIARTDVKKDAIIDSKTFSSITATAQVSQLLEPGMRAITVQVDQVSGVGTLIQPGDRVDVVLSMSEADQGKNPIVVEGAPTKEGQPPSPVRNFHTIDDLLNNTTVKVLVQNVKVIGTLLPSPTATTGGAEPGASAAPAGPALNGQAEIVVLAVTPQQAEQVRFTQLDGNLSLILRSPQDDAAVDVKTTGITLRTLVDKYGVLPPKIILTTQP